MATSISLEKYDGYPTSTAMRVYVLVNTTYAGSYKVHFSLKNSSGTVVSSGYGNTFSMTDNDSITKADDFYKTFSGLNSNKTYTITATLYNAATGKKVEIRPATLKFTTLSPATLTVKYFDGSKSWSESSTTSVKIDGPYRTDWDFVGWATSTKSTSVSTKYVEGAEISVGTTSETVSLYAVYGTSTTIYCYFIDGSTGAIDSNERIKTQYRVNTSTSASSTDYYNTIKLPTFSSKNSSITTTNPKDLTWSALGWRRDKTAANKEYSAGQNVATNHITGNLYAVYTRGCSITYNANSGSGTMENSTGNAYYNAYGNYVGGTLTIKDCAFTPPTGMMFDSWNQKSDGSGATYSGSVTTVYNVIFYAIWVKAKPTKWAWVTTGISSGATIPSSRYTIVNGEITKIKLLTADEWIAFMNKIKSVYTYKNVTIDSTYWYRAVNGVSSGNEMTKTQANGARYLINQLNPSTSVPAAIPDNSTTVITADFINGLMNSYNSIVEEL